MGKVARPAIYLVKEREKPAAAQTSARTNQLTLTVLVAIAFVVSLFPLHRVYLWDEAVYLANAENLFSSSPYYSELDFRPPLLSVLLYLGSYVMPMAVFARLLSAAFFACAVLLLYLLGSRLYGYLEGLSAAILMLISPFFLYWAPRVMADIPATVLVLASIFFLFRHLENPGEDPWSVLFSGVLLTSAVLMRWVCGLAGICAVYFLATRRMRLQMGLVYAAGIAAAMAPYLLWAQLVQGSIFKPFYTAFVVVERGSEAVGDRLYYLEGLYQVAGPITLFGLILYLYLLSKGVPGWASRDFPIFLWFAAFLIYLSTMTHKETRYVLPAMPALFLLAGRGFSSLRDQRTAGLAALVVPLAGLYMLAHLDYFKGVEGWMRTMLDYSADTRNAAVYVKDKVPPGSVLYANHLWPVLAYHSKRRTIALWPRDDRFYRSYPKNMMEDGYFVYYRGVEKKPDQEWLDQRPEFHKEKEFRNIVIYSYKYPGERAIDPDFKRRIEEARAQFNQGSYDKVVEILAPLKIPDVDVGDLRGWSYYRMGKINEAAEAFRHGLLSEPTNPRCLTGLGYCELRLGEPDLARGHFQAAVDQIPEKTDALVGLGIAQLRLGNKSAAAQVLRKALALAPANEEVKNYLKEAEAP